MLQYHWLYVFQVVSILLYHCYLLSIRNTKIDRWYRIHKIIHSKFKCIDVLFLLNGFPHTNMRGGLKVFDDGFLTHYEHGKPPILFKLSDQTIYIRFLFSVIKWSIAFFHFPSAKPTNKRESEKTASTFSISSSSSSEQPCFMLFTFQMQTLSALNEWKRYV